MLPLASPRVRVKCGLTKFSSLGWKMTLFLTFLLVIKTVTVNYLWVKYLVDVLKEHLHIHGLLDIHYFEFNFI